MIYEYTCYFKLKISLKCKTPRGTSTSGQPWRPADL